MGRDTFFSDDEISIHAPREGGDVTNNPFDASPVWISIHAPREGGDDRPPKNRKRLENFNPRPPRGGRHDAPIFKRKPILISIHAPREGGDFNIE